MCQGNDCWSNCVINRFDRQGPHREQNIDIVRVKKHLDQQIILQPLERVRNWIFSSMPVKDMSKNSVASKREGDSGYVNRKNSPKTTPVVSGRSSLDRVVNTES